MDRIQYKKVFYKRNSGLNIDENCHECISHSLDKHGYHQIRKNKKTHRIHRWLYLKNNFGEIPECVMHLCDNRLCINLKHLKGGTKKENNQNMHNKGRGKGTFTKGQRNYSKLTIIDVK